MKIQSLFILFAALLVSCHSISQTTGTVQATPKYTFKKVDVLTVSPCVECIMTKVKRKYRRPSRAIPFERCVSGSQDKRFLKLSVVRGSEEHKMVISPDCGEGLTVTGIGFCPAPGDCGMGASGDGWVVTVNPTIYCDGQPILSIEMNDTSVRILTLASGWDLYYEVVNCPGN